MRRVGGGEHLHIQCDINHAKNMFGAPWSNKLLPGHRFDFESERRWAANSDCLEEEIAFIASFVQRDWVPDDKVQLDSTQSVLAFWSA